MLHLHCENGCEKVDFVLKNAILHCIKCGGEAKNVLDCDCLKTKNHKKPLSTTSKNILNKFEELQ